VVKKISDFARLTGRAGMCDFGFFTEKAQRRELYFPIVPYCAYVVQMIFKFSN
jgi:hypothetical protein